MTLRFTLLTILLALPRPGAAGDDETGRLRSSVVRAIEAASLLPAEAAAAGTEAAPASSADREPRWGLTTALGFGSAGGDFGDLLQKPVAGDYNIFRNRGAWRFGLGLSFTSFEMVEPYQDEKEWGFQQSYLFATRMLRKEGAVRPYLQLRAGAARLHPRSELFAFEPPPEEPGDSPTRPANGWSAGLVPGLELQLNQSLALDVSGHFNWWSVSEYDLSPVNFPNASSGSTYEARIGLRWHPDDGWFSGVPGSDHPSRPRDAWGVSRNLGWGIAQNLAINWVSSGVNEYLRNANFNQISPRSWWGNLEHGLTFDDNEFKTNQYLHPWNGGMYYNTGRSNGFGYWGAALFALGGAFFWECCGETHPMSYNDLISTGIGGVAVGEQMYRMSSQLLDNHAGGVERVLRETGGFLIAPVRGFNRLVSGRASAKHANPEDPQDWRGSHARFLVSAGVRVIGEGESLSENTNSYSYLGLHHTFGNVFENKRRKPFDSITADYQFSFGDKEPRTILRIHGDIASWALGSGKDAPNYAFSIVQHFDYHNNFAYEFGQQAFGPSLFGRHRLSDTWGLSWRWDGSVAILAAVNSDYAFLAQVPDRERYREYDYGPGLGTGAEIAINRGKNRILSLGYRFQWITVRNGSIFNPEEDDEGGIVKGSEADHYLHAVQARLFIPLYKRKVGLGADALVLLRKSYYSLDFLRDRDQRNPEARIYLAFDLGH
jgi:hypothetical protein